jgi:hypothetical protein
MKYNRIAATMLLAMLASFFTSCEFTDGYEVDPNNAGDAPTATIYNSALVGTIVPISGENARLATMWSRQFMGFDRQYAAYHIYNMSAPDFAWDYHYTTWHTQIDLVLERSTESGNDFYSGNMLTLKGLSYGTLTSLWGDVPFSEANKFPEIEDPKFDSQIEVYAGIQGLLDQALAAYATGVGGPSGGNDFFFNGDKAKWIAATNSLKARYFLHVRNYAAARTAAQNGISSTSNDMVIPHSGVYNQNMNLYHSFLVLDRQFYLTAYDSYLARLLDPTSATYRGDNKTDESNRFSFIFKNTADGYDINASDAGIFGASSSFPVITYVETQLILAEAALELGDRAAALTALNAVRAANVTSFGIKADAYLESELAGDALKREILEEKYISLVGQIEVYNDVRRTNNLLGIPSTGTGNDGIPKRFLYPQSEVSANQNAPSPIPGLFQATPVNQ